MGVPKNQQLSYEKRLKIGLCENNTKEFREIASPFGCSMSTAFVVCKKFSLQEEKKIHQR